MTRRRCPPAATVATRSTTTRCPDHRGAAGHTFLGGRVGRVHARQADLWSSSADLRRPPGAALHEELRPGPGPSPAARVEIDRPGRASRTSPSTTSRIDVSPSSPHWTVCSAVVQRGPGDELPPEPPTRSPPRRLPRRADTRSCSRRLPEPKTPWRMGPSPAGSASRSRVIGSPRFSCRARAGASPSDDDETGAGKADTAADEAAGPIWIRRSAGWPRDADGDHGHEGLSMCHERDERPARAGRAGPMVREPRALRPSTLITPSGQHHRESARRPTSSKRAGARRPATDLGEAPLSVPFPRIAGRIPRRLRTDGHRAGRQEPLPPQPRGGARVVVGAQMLGASGPRNCCRSSSA